MLHYAVVFFIIALIAAVFGFGGIAAGAVGIAKVLFFVFLVLAALTFVANLISMNAWGCVPCNARPGSAKDVPYISTPRRPCTHQSRSSRPAVHFPRDLQR